MKNSRKTEIFVGRVLVYFGLSGTGKVLFTNLPVPVARTRDFSSVKVARATQRLREEYMTSLRAATAPCLTGRKKSMSNEVVSTNTSGTRELAAKKQASSKSLKY